MEGEGLLDGGRIEEGRGRGGVLRERKGRREEGGGRGRGGF